jgi:hypothetical protein
VGEGQDLSRGQQPDGGFAYLGKPDVVAGCLAYVAIPDSSAHVAGENNERYSKPHMIEKKKSPRAASNASA